MSLLVKIDQLYNIGVVYSCSLDEKTIVIGKLFLIARMELVCVD